MVSLLDATVFLLCFAVAGLHVLDYLLAICPHSVGGAVALLALPTAYFTGVILVYLQIAPAPRAPVSQVVALRLLAAMACALLLLAAIIMFMPLAPWLFSM
ncbi:unnamed protein product [Miscanthus lutarioriparius]|uniref:Uncharacterized protein n=1 Tax=Miscanthus lutarioriparius TaxID=422564 RepID=A0A811S8R5_9POAL|nr:unnamed protein product [Miscanthus lutarioriparius]